MNELRWGRHGGLPHQNTLTSFIQELLAKEFLDWANLMGEVELQRTRRTLWEAISWFHQFGKADSDTLRQAINDNLEAKRSLDDSDSSSPMSSGPATPSPFPPTFYRHTTGNGQFWRVQRDYHGSWNQDEHWNPANEI